MTENEYREINQVIRPSELSREAAAPLVKLLDRPDDLRAAYRQAKAYAIADDHLDRMMEHIQLRAGPVDLQKLADYLVLELARRYP